MAVVRADEGATRHCDLPGGRWLSERATDWQEGESFRIVIEQSNLPLKSSSVRFAVEPIADRTRVSVEPQYELRGGPLGRLFDRLFVRHLYVRGFRDMLAGLKDHVEAEGAGRPPPGPGADPKRAII